jgi:enamine deaminase RidA (YjgF/YER057c/UK114 family)
MKTDEREKVSSGSPYEASVGFSRAVKVGRQVFVSGTAPIGPDGWPVHSGDAYKQAKRCFEVIGKALQQLGGSLKDVVRTRIYLVSAADSKAVARAHGEVFGDTRPAATMIAVKELLEPEWLVEIEADAILSE